MTVKSNSAAPPTPERSLQRALGPIQYLTIGIGTMIGVGWAIVLGEWISAAGPLGACLGFIIGGFAMTLVALCYAELSTALPRAGGEVIYMREVFGARTGFAVGWFIVLGATAMTSFEGISFGWFIGRLFPEWIGKPIEIIPGVSVGSNSLLLGVLGSALITWINYHGARGSGRLQDAFTGIKAAAALIFIGGAVAFGKTDNLVPVFSHSNDGSLLTGILGVVGTAPLWMSGFQVVPQAIEERGPQTSLRTLGNVMIAIVPIGVLFYCAVIIAASMSAPWHAVARDPLPARLAIESALGHGAVSRIVLFGVVLGIIATWNACFLWASRLLFGLSREGLVGESLGSINKFGAPGLSTLLIGLLGAAGLVLGRAGLIPLVNIASMAVAVAFFLCSVAVLRLRASAPEMPRPFRVWGGSVVVWIAVVASGALALVSLLSPFFGESRLPIEWVLIAVWGALGLVLRWRTERRSAEIGQGGSKIAPPPAR